MLTAPTETIGDPTLAQVTEIRQTLDLQPKVKIDYDLITKLANTLASEAKKQSGLVAIFTNSPLDTGVALQAFRLFEPSGKAGVYGSYYMNPALTLLRSESAVEAVVAISLARERDDTKAMWKIYDKSVTPPEAGNLEKFRESLAALDQPETPRLQIIISVLHRDDLEKLKQLIQPTDDEESESPEE